MQRVVEYLNLALAVFSSVALAILYEGTGLTKGVLVILAALVIVVNVAYALRMRHDGEHGRELSISTEEGTSHVSIPALEKQLLDGLASAKDVQDATIRLAGRGEGLPLHCRLAFKLERQSDVTGRVDAIKKTVRDAFLQIIPSGAGIEITADVVDLIPPGSAAVKAKPASGEFLGGADYSAYEQSDADEMQG